MRKPAFVRVSWNSRARAFRVGVENLINRERSTSLQYLTIGASFNFVFRVPPSLFLSLSPSHILVQFLSFILL